MDLSENKEKLLLALLPFWTPLIPPVGIISISKYLTSLNIKIKSVDYNTQEVLNDYYQEYFNTLAQNITKEKRGNFYNMGHDVLNAHLLALINKSEETYLKLINDIIYKNFAVNVSVNSILQLTDILNRYFQELGYLFISQVEEFKPTILGLSVYRGTLASSLCISKLIKTKYPEIKILMGGAIFSQELYYGSENFERFNKKATYIDHIFLGESEELIYKFLTEKLEHKRIYCLDDINKQYIDISSVQLDNLKGFELQYYPYLPTFASRSCQFQCGFCAETINFGKYRKRNIDIVIKEMTTLSRLYKYQLFLFCDSLLNPVINELATKLKESDNSLYWDGYLRIDKQSCNRQTVLSWRNGGFYRARLGIESGSQRVLNLMDKRITLEQVQQSLICLSEAGIKTSTMWIVGYPGETDEDFKLTLDFITIFQDYIYEAECNPFRFFPFGQVNSKYWSDRGNSIRLYNTKGKDELLVDTWIIDDPQRNVVLDRMNQFVNLCNKLSIPNPYSLHDISQADMRWKNLHENAVPSLLDFKTQNMNIKECKGITLRSESDETADIFNDDFSF